jgi:membrane-associated phospholipid phosphatase
MNAEMPTPADHRLAPHRRLLLALTKARGRMSRGGGAEPEAVWTRAMSAWFVAGLIAVFAVSFADEAAIRFVHDSDSSVIRFMAYITNIGRSQWYLVPAALVFGAVALADWSRGGRRAKARLSLLFGQAAYVFSSVALSGLFVNAIKVLFGRARPRLLDQVGAHYFDPLTFGYLNASFPSGHSTTVGAIVGILIIWYPRWSLLIIELGLFIAATRIAAQAHYPSDVIAGFLVGLFFSIGLARWLAGRGVVFRFVPGKILPVTAVRSPTKSLPS